MQELEVIKHLSSAHGIWRNRKHSLLQKLGKIVVEILIIVFAVILSIWFHERSTSKHEQKDVEYFLKALKVDLKRDIEEMKSDRAGYLKEKAAFEYIVKTKLHHPLNLDSLNKHSEGMFLKILLLPNDGRFEGFKSSGKIGGIKNMILQNDIMDLYQEDYSILKYVLKSHGDMKDYFIKFFMKNFKKESDSVSNIATIFTTNSEGRNICYFIIDNDVLDSYDRCIAKAEKIVAEIDAEYKLKD